MTHSGGKPHTNVGDKGQRYEVSYQETEDASGPRKVLGWSETKDGARRLVRMVELHPSMHVPHIWDREKEEPVTL